MKPLVVRQFLQDYASLCEYLSGGEPRQDEIIRRAFVLERQRQTDLPDHYFQSWLKHYAPDLDNRGVWGLIKRTLEVCGAEYLEYRGGQLYVAFDRFGEWQKEITAMSPLAIIAYKVFCERGPPGSHTPHALARYVDNNLRQFTHSLLIAPYEPIVEDLIAQVRLNEIHLHLNGSTEVDILWQDALRDPIEFGRTIRDAMLSSGSGHGQMERLAELYDQIALGIRPERVAQMLRFAKRLRIALLGAVTATERAWRIGRLADEASEVDIGNSAGTDPRPLAGLLGQTADRDNLALRTELLLLILVFDTLQRTTDSNLAQILHAYLLVLNSVFVKFCVQQIEQRGFDQFQKLTYTEFRTRAEREYRDRFLQLSLGGRDLRILEGRFAPPDSVEKTNNLLTRIVRGYRQFNERDETLRPVLSEQPDETGEAAGVKLRLIAHFIKRDELATLSGLATCRFERLRNDFARRWRALRQSLDSLPAVSHYVTGIDGAANEMHTPPEVFAPLYRAARAAGMVNFTFHAGEDFAHLISGIRAIYEAVDFLELKRGNRIAHATAIGIDPSLYLERMPAEIAMRRGDRLDDLVFAYKLLGVHGRSSRALLPLQSDIRTLSQAIYKVSHPPEVLWAAWALRRLDALQLQRKNHWDAIEPDVEREIKALQEARKADEEAFRVFEAYHHPDVIERATEYCSGVQTAKLDSEALTVLQNWVMQNKVIDNGIVLETLPTSNVRISFYRDYFEHHVYRWLGLLPGQHPTPTICVGSDDPGIFACNLRGEYMHLFREIGKLTSKSQAREILQKLNDAGRLHHFAYGRR